MTRWLRLPTPGTSIALAALVVVSSGSAVAVTVITSKQIKNGTIQLADLSPAAKKALRSAAGAAGVPGRSALEPLHSGETLRGAWAMNGDGAIGSFQVSGVTLPIPRPVPGDGCSGTASAPVAAPGFVCAYFASATGTNRGQGSGARADLSDVSASFGSGDGSSYGFVIFVNGLAGRLANGTWANTAP